MANRTGLLARIFGQKKEQKAQAKKTYAELVIAIVESRDSEIPTDEADSILRDAGKDENDLAADVEKEVNRRELIRIVEAGDAAAESSRQAQAEIAAANQKYLDDVDKAARDRFETCSKWTPVLSDSQRRLSEAATARVKLSEIPTPARQALLAESRAIGETVQDANHWERELRSRSATVKAAETQLAAAVLDRDVKTATRKLAGAKAAVDHAQSQLDACRGTVELHQSRWADLESAALESSVAIQ